MKTISASLVIAVVIIAAASIIAVNIYVTNNRYDISTSSDAAYKIDKRTGEMWFIAGPRMFSVSNAAEPESDTSEPESDTLAPFPEIRSLPPEEMNRITCNPESSSSRTMADLMLGCQPFEAIIHNESKWFVQEIYFVVTATEANGTIRWSRRRIYEVYITSGSTSEFSVCVSGATGAEISFEIDDVRGYPGSEHPGW
ncbi:MAG: hypothetical protein JW936_04460 [Sedimentisphaerales bacterium]|nr:hypothetical protein [Sedimentisphaerales bacterium]